MNINNLGLLNSLATIINERMYDSDYAIAEYILHHINNIQTVSINMIMDEAFVSRSAIRRFCNRLGYDNFSELKHSLTDIIFPSNIHLRRFETVGHYRKNITKELSEMLLEMNEMISDKQIDDLADLIHAYDDVSIISANNTSANLLKFQQELFYAQKIIKLVDNNFQKNQSELPLDASNLTIVVSVSGVFAQAMEDILSRFAGEKILITGRRHKRFESTYDQIIYISKDDILEDEMGLYGKYGITYFFDLLSEHYIFKYKN